LHPGAIASGRRPSEDGASAEAPAEPKESAGTAASAEKEGRRKARTQGASEGPDREGREASRPVLGFLLSCWAELKRVQWAGPRHHWSGLAVTFIFVAVMAAYLGALDAAFNWFIKQLL